MNAEEYYQKNTILHGAAGETELFDPNVRPSRPSEVDHALRWFHELQISGSILDVGCGPLGLLRKSASLFEKRTGVDIVSYPIWQAEERGIHTQICNLDAGCLPFGDESFDAITMLMVLEHVFDPFHAVCEVRRVIKPTGAVVIGVPNIASIKHRFGLLFGRFPVTSARHSFTNEAWDGYHLHNFTKQSLEWLFTKCGLTPLRWGAQGGLQSLKRIRPSLFGHDLVALCVPNDASLDKPPCF